jgi:iron complex outermembrane recepter protein
VGVKNLFDKSPPASAQAATFQVGYDPRFTDPFLRSYYIRGTYKF